MSYAQFVVRCRAYIATEPSHDDSYIPFSILTQQNVIAVVDTQDRRFISTAEIIEYVRVSMISKLVRTSIYIKTYVARLEAKPNIEFFCRYRVSYKYR